MSVDDPKKSRTGKILDELREAHHSNISSTKLTAITTDDVSYYEAQIDVSGPNQEDVSQNVMDEIVPFIKQHSLFDETSHVETVVPVGGTKNSFTYQVILREYIE